MNCETTRQRILDLDNECDPGREAGVAEHLSGCDDCRRFYTDVRRVWTAMGSVPELDTTPDFNRSVWSKIGAQRKRTPLRLLTLMVLPPPLRVAAWAALLVAAVTAGFLVYDAAHRPAPAPAITVTNADRQDDQMLMELDALINFDESQVFSTYQDWKMVPASKEKTPPRQDNQKPQRQPVDPRLNQDMKSNAGWINQA
jgi:hypothetical protein